MGQFGLDCCNCGCCGGTPTGQCCTFCGHTGVMYNTYTMTVAGITNGDCDACGGYNDDYTLTYVGNCTWTGGIGPPCGAAGPAWRLFCTGYTAPNTTWSLTNSVHPTDTTWTATGPCDDTLTFAIGPIVGSGCTNYPATIEVVPSGDPVTCLYCTCCRGTEYDNYSLTISGVVCGCGEYNASFTVARTTLGCDWELNTTICGLPIFVQLQIGCPFPGLVQYVVLLTYNGDPDVPDDGWSVNYTKAFVSNPPDCGVERNMSGGSVLINGPDAPPCDFTGMNVVVTPVIPFARRPILKRKTGFMGKPVLDPRTGLPVVVIDRAELINRLRRRKAVLARKPK